MATGYSTAYSAPRLFRGNHRVWLYGFLAILSLYILHSIFIRREVIIIKHGDLNNDFREPKLQDDKSPFAHEPVGLGTLRDVREDNFYRGGTLSLEHGHGEAHPSPMVLDPYPNYNDAEWRKEFTGSYRACQGPRGTDLNRWNPDDVMSVYPGVPQSTDTAPPHQRYSYEAYKLLDFPQSLIGSYSALQLEAAVCANRYSRLSAYGYEGNNTQNAFGVWQPPKTDWSNVRWGTLQSNCLERNIDRFGQLSHPATNLHILPPTPPAPKHVPRADSSSSTSGPRQKARSVVVLRAWHDMEWTENHKQYVRSLIMELSLHSGGEYDVLILCHVRDRSISIDGNDAEAIEALKGRFVPPEFADMTVLFNDQTLESWYPLIEEHKTVTQYWQPVQILSEALEGFDYFWQLEMDARFTGHAYEILERAAEFAKEQPRKYLWERNSYFYIPGAHGTWPQFKGMVEKSMRGRNSIWGPKDLSGIVSEGSVATTKPPMVAKGPKPPVASPQDDKFDWGVGEESDLITFLPTFDPAATRWVFSDTMWNVRQDAPRQASPVAMGRVSKQLLQQMHLAQSQWGIAMSSEMTAPTLALWHGFKAVHVPQPVYVDGKWTSKELGRIMNPGVPEKINGGEDSIWNWDHKWDHILYRFTYLFSSQTPENLYRRWMGYPIDPAQYTDGTYHQDPQGRNWFETGDLREDLYGPLCFPSMLLHPVKNPERKKGTGMAVPV